MVFHEHIHICEQYFTAEPLILILDYREKSGLLEKKFNISWLQESTTQLKTGDVYLQFSELGKTPYTYWKDKEPNDINRMCELAKPWVLLKPKVHVALEDIDRLADKTANEFNQWWSNYHLDWCKFWNLPTWTLEMQYGVIKFGKIDNIEFLKTQIDNKIFPKKIIL